MGRSEQNVGSGERTGEDVEHIYDQRSLIDTPRGQRHWALSGDARPRQGRSGRMHHKTRFNPCERLRCTPS